MNEFDFEKKLREAAQSEREKIPADFAEAVQKTLNALPQKIAARPRIGKRIVAAAAVIAALFVALPNISPDIAYAMEKIPVIGSVVKVITIRTYLYDDGHNTLSAEVPELQQQGDAAGKVNDEAAQYIQTLVDRFNADAIEEGYLGLDVTWDIATDTDSWFALRISGVQTMASGYEFTRYYNIDKRTDKLVALGDLFKADADYIAAIKESIIGQMKDAMAKDENLTYWIDDSVFPSDYEALISKEGAFYLNAEGELVIAFDEYDVAPGFMGSQEFTVPTSAIADILAK